MAKKGYGTEDKSMEQVIADRKALHREAGRQAERDKLATQIMGPPPGYVPLEQQLDQIAKEKGERRKELVFKETPYAIGGAALQMTPAEQKKARQELAELYRDDEELEAQCQALQTIIESFDVQFEEIRRRMKMPQEEREAMAFHGLHIEEIGDLDEAISQLSTEMVDDRVLGYAYNRFRRRRARLAWERDTLQKIQKKRRLEEMQAPLRKDAKGVLKEMTSLMKKVDAHFELAADLCAGMPRTHPLISGRLRKLIEAEIERLQDEL